MLISLLTDFGTKDYFVGAMKGVILSINSEAKIIDITHDIEPQNIQSAGFTLASCYQNFPSKTIFVSVVDPGVGSNRRAILVETKNYYFIAPDNCLLSLVLNNESDYRVFELTNPKFFLSNISQTFHGRDVFAPVAAWLSKGISPNEFGSKTTELAISKNAVPKRISADKIIGNILHIDNFGNLITNIRKSDLTTNFSIRINENMITKHQTFYAEAEEDEIFTIWGSAGYLEIVAYCNSAKDLLKARINDEILAKLL